MIGKNIIPLRSGMFYEHELSEYRHFPVEESRNKRLLFMVTDVVSTRFADSERCLESHKITTVTLNEIRGASFFPLAIQGKMLAPDLRQPIFEPNGTQRYWFNFFFSRYLFFFLRDSFLKRIQFFSLRNQNLQRVID